MARSFPSSGGVYLPPDPDIEPFFRQTTILLRHAMAAQEVCAKISNPEERRLTMAREARLGNMLDFMYSPPTFRGDAVDGMGAFRKLLGNTDYYIAVAESNAISYARDRIANFFGNLPDFVEFGPGPWNSIFTKTLLVLMHYLEGRADLRISSFEGIDTSKDAVAAVDRYVSRLLRSRRIASSSRLARFGDLGAALLNKPNLCGLFFGNTAANDPSLLVDIYRAISYAGGKIVVGQNCNQDRKSLDAAYDNKEIAELTKNLLHRMVRDLRAEFEPRLDREVSGFEYIYRCDEEDYHIRGSLAALTDYKITLTDPFLGTREVFLINRDTELQTWDSGYAPYDEFQKTVSDIGYVPIDVAFDDSRKPRVGVHFLEVPKNPLLTAERDPKDIIARALGGTRRPRERRTPGNPTLE